MKLIFSNRHKTIAVFLMVIFLLPVLLMLTTGVAEAATGSLFDENTPIIRALGIILLAFLLDKTIGEQKVDLNSGDPPVTIIPDTSYEPYPDYHYSSNGDKEIVGFYVNWEIPGVESYPSLKKNYKSIDIVSPFWYTITATGNIETKYGGVNSEVISLMRKSGNLILPLINNNKANSLMLTDANIRRKAINNVVNLVQTHNYDGVNIDFELIPSWSKNGYTTFVKELSQKLHSLGKLLHICVFPKVGVSYDIHGAYDYNALAPYVDRFVIMTYDNHWATGSPGPIAPIKWVEENILYALKYIPAEKILLGIANYGYDWPAKGKGQDIAAKKAIDLAKRKNARINWDSSAQAPYFSYYDSNGIKHEVWFESSYSMDLKLNLVNKYHLKGIAIWRLGNEEDRFWEIIKTRFKK